jgi:hypothetical protein
MASIAMPKHDQKRWKQLFATSLRRMNGDATAASQRPILQSKPDRANTPKAAIAEAANCLAALWDISKPKRHDRRWALKPIRAPKTA